MAFNKTRIFLISAALLAAAAMVIRPGSAGTSVTTADPNPKPISQVPLPQTTATPPDPALVPPPGPAPEPERPTIDVVFALDTTGSMGGLLEGAKQKIWSIASEIARGQPTPILRVGLVAYRDVGDSYVTRKFPLNRDLDAVFVNLRSFRADGGGDTPEHVGRALADAVTKMGWSQDPKTMKLIYLVGDAPPQDYQDGYSASGWAKKAWEKGIVVHAIRCGEDPETGRAFTRLSRLGQGSYFSIGQTGGMVAVATPYDAELKKLNDEIARKTLYGGAKPARDAARSKAEASSAMPASAAADRMMFNSINTGAGISATAAPAPEPGSVDLTAAPAQAAAMPVDALPEELQSVASGERQAKLEQMQQERKALEKQATELSRQRADWMDKNVKDKGDAFDTNVKESLKGRAAEYGIKY